MKTTAAEPMAASTAGIDGDPETMEHVMGALRAGNSVHARTRGRGTKITIFGYDGIGGKPVLFNCTRGYLTLEEVKSVAANNPDKITQIQPIDVIR